ncbi:MAG: DNA polymerase I [Spirochaetaceae bacterium]|nr:DNA polymerase I [Spirochaetaceae bacterium]
MKPPLYIVDAYGLIYRSYFAFLAHPLLNAAGNNISALFGFARTVTTLIDDGVPAVGNDHHVKRLVAVFDSLLPTFRHKKYPAYKATRQKTPEDLHDQVPLVEEFLSALGVDSLRADGFEADDIIATLVKKCRAEKRQCYILSADKDLLQLVGDGVWELRPRKGSLGDGNPAGAPQGGGLNYELMGPEEIKAEWGVPPEKVLDLLSLVGDASDNVPGVKGIGEKTAVKLMARYGSLEEIYENIAGIEGAIGKKLAQGQESAFFARELIALDSGVPLAVKDLEEFSIEKLDRAAAAVVLLREGIKQVARQLDPRARSAEGERSHGTAFWAISRASSISAGAPGEEAAQKPVVDPALLGPGTYRAVLDIAELESILKAGRKNGVIAFDFETDGLDAWNAKPIGISLAVKSKEAVYVPVVSHRGTRAGGMDNAPFIEPGRVRDLLLPLFADPDMTIIAHNAKFDYKVSRGWGVPRWDCRIWDTMVAAWVDDSDRGNYSLDFLAALHFDYNALAYNDVVPRGWTFEQVDLETAVRYSAEDADLCFRMKTMLEKRLAAPGAAALFYNLEMPLLPVLAEMEGVGIKIDPAALEKYGIELAGELKEIERKAYDMVGHTFNLGSTKQLQEVLFRERKLIPGKKTKTGYSTDVAVLEELARVDPVPALILRHRTLAKLKSTYVDTLAAQAGKNQRIHTNFVQTGTATGRLSSREPNLQNIPIRDEEGRRIRAAFIAEADHVLISADYSQIELVVLAHLSGDENLITAFQEGKDVHSRTASLIFGIRESDIDGNQRRIAKTINFGVMYGMSAYRLASELGISRAEATEFIAAYFRTYAGVKRLVGELIKKTEETGYASTILGRRRYIRAINSRNKTEKAAAERVAVNTPIQGSAADIVKTAMLKLDRRLAETASPARLLLQVHDELILECPKNGAEEAALLVRNVMENAVTLSVPLRVSVETGKRWGDFH